jgi:hypothetical protein
MGGAIPPLPHYTFMAWCLVQHRDNFTFTFTFTMQDDILVHTSTMTKSGWLVSVKGQIVYNSYMDSLETGFIEQFLCT